MQISNTDAYPTKCNTFIDLWYDRRFGFIKDDKWNKNKKVFDYDCSLWSHPLKDIFLVVIFIDLLYCAKSILKTAYCLRMLITIGRK